ncbi:glucose PTS transporter subunit IIA [[Mycoplasma] testudinis]|uniref:glucose PTS transporter subunit IIA n=1 Tax=[Mycoplasma] testudinis TaxID=33924 RepID=UPI000481D0A7|nr:glucose PTS transporter subunit IIA [[Mycoplasma] testudinis]
MQYKELAQDIIDKVGGPENITSIKHCMTRLRLVLKDDKKPDTEAVKKLNGVLSVVKSGGQYQIVIGNEVKNVYSEATKIWNPNNLNISSTGGSATDGIQIKKKKMISKLIDFIVAVIIPVVPILIVSGTLKGIVAIMAVSGVPTTDTMYLILENLGDATFSFLPVFVAINVAKRKDMNVYVAVAIALFLAIPPIVYNISGSIASVNSVAKQPIETIFQGTIFQTNIYQKIGNFPIIWPAGGYTSSFIPIIVILLVVAKLEKFLKRVTPKSFSLFSTNLIVFFIGGFAGLLFLGPLASWFQQIIAYIVDSIYAFSPVLVGLVLGFFWQILVIFGLHWAVNPLQLLQLQSGSSVIMAISFLPFVTQIGIVFAIALIERKTINKSQAIGALVSGVFGITEPSIYGFTLPRKKPFFLSCAISAVICAIAGAFDLHAFGFALGFTGLPLFLDPVNGVNQNFYVTVILCFAGIIVSFIFMLMFYKLKLPVKWNLKLLSWKNTTIAKYNVFKTAIDKKITVPVRVNVVNPVKKFSKTVKAKFEFKNKNKFIYFGKNGEYVPLTEVKDSVFASGALGEGFALKNFNSNEIKALQEFEVMFVADTKHAIALKTKKGLEMLIHVGLDTVNLKGQFFDVDLKAGDIVKKGDTILKFDYQKIAEAGYDNSIIVTFPSREQYKDIVIQDCKKFIRMEIQYAK